MMELMRMCLSRKGLSLSCQADPQATTSAWPASVQLQGKSRPDGLIRTMMISALTPMILMQRWMMRLMITPLMGSASHPQMMNLMAPDAPHARHACPPFCIPINCSLAYYCFNPCIS